MKYFIKIVVFCFLFIILFFALLYLKKDKTAARSISVQKAAITLPAPIVEIFKSAELVCGNVVVSAVHDSIINFSSDAKLANNTLNIGAALSSVGNISAQSAKLVFHGGDPSDFKSGPSYLNEFKTYAGRTYFIFEKDGYTILKNGFRVYNKEAPKFEVAWLDDYDQKFPTEIPLYGFIINELSGRYKLILMGNSGSYVFVCGNFKL